MKIITELEIAAAVKTLAGSEKGREALRVQLAWLEDSGLSLDSMNQRAVLTLLVATWTGKAGMVREAIHAELEQPAHA